MWATRRSRPARWPAPSRRWSAQGLPAEPGRGTLRLRLERDATSFHVDVTAPHLPLTPPPVGLMDRVSVHAGPGRHPASLHAPPAGPVAGRWPPYLTMRLYNTLTRTGRAVCPRRPDDTVRMYTCGLTVYNRGHIGNFRTFVCLDVLRRTLQHVCGWRVHQVMNFTDVDDRTILGAQKAGQDLRTYTTQYVEAFREDAAALGLEPVEDTPRATDEANLEAMANLVHALEKNGHTYRSDGSIYFRIASFPAYGKLARLDQEGHQARRPRRQRQLRQRRRAGLRAVEGDQARRADLGLRAGPRTPGLAPGMLGDGAAAAGAAAHRPARRRHRPDLPASRKRDRAERRRHGHALLAVLGARRAPDHRQREDVQVARQRLQRQGRRRSGVPALGAAVPAAVEPLSQATALFVGHAAAGRRVAPPAGGRADAARYRDRRSGESGDRRGPGPRARRVRRGAAGRPEHIGRAGGALRPRARPQHRHRRRDAGRSRRGRGPGAVRAFRPRARRALAAAAGRRASAGGPGRDRAVDRRHGRPPAVAAISPPATVSATSSPAAASSWRMGRAGRGGSGSRHEGKRTKDEGRWMRRFSRPRCPARRPRR